ncbi:CDP-glycerol glycerophosphotransferase family protein [Neorhizobium sp. NCHU2750]|uniref:CDP-glycerol glycerophosphotransferase family protein n=1 Tax=Neorhizobium sp. NCHU2750 TaxID=1825976 RepID=UPI000E75F643|nr:hypothetical protein NCHU2750_03260 [Neorhizobium sp. NCHU2750]
MTQKKIVFYGWNPFQLLHFRRLIKAIPGACFILENRENSIKDFAPELLNDPLVPVIVIESAKVPALNAIADVVVCQNEFPLIETFTRAKIAMVQYGYAKEPHNYGPWRVFADLNLAYGPYAVERMAYFAPSVDVGNPQYDDWFDESFHQRARAKYGPRLDPARKTILYAPTWGDLSSIDRFLGAVQALSGDYNVLLKIHHNTQRREAGRRDAVTNLNTHHFGASDALLDLISVSDVVISDYSGAIFDAVFCSRPIVLLNDQKSSSSDKMDDYSIEFSRRGELGLQVDHPGDLKAVVDRAASDPNAVMALSEALRNELFTDRPDATEEAAKAILDLANGKYQPSQMQTYLRKEIRAFRETSRQLGVAVYRMRQMQMSSAR